MSGIGAARAGGRFGKLRPLHGKRSLRLAAFQSGCHEVPNMQASAMRVCADAMRQSASTAAKGGEGRRLSYCEASIFEPSRTFLSFLLQFAAALRLLKCRVQLQPSYNSGQNAPGEPIKAERRGFEPLTRQGMKNAPGPGHKKCCKWCAVRDVRAFASRSRTACARLQRAPAGNMPKGMLPPLGFESLTAFPKKQKAPPGALRALKKWCAVRDSNPRRTDS